jgi:hypothetical protein
MSFTDLSTDMSYPKTLFIRNTEGGMIWQVYHVHNDKQAHLVSKNAKDNAFHGRELVDYDPTYEETFPNWREELATFYSEMLPEHLTLKTDKS